MARLKTRGCTYAIQEKSLLIAPVWFFKKRKSRWRMQRLLAILKKVSTPLLSKIAWPGQRLKKQPRQMSCSSTRFATTGASMQCRRLHGRQIHHLRTRSITFWPWLSIVASALSELMFSASIKAVQTEQFNTAFSVAHTTTR